LLAQAPTRVTTGTLHMTISTGGIHTGRTSTRAMPVMSITGMITPMTIMGTIITGMGICQGRRPLPGHGPGGGRQRWLLRLVFGHAQELSACCSSRTASA
jgi:hypothetical protein